MFELQQYKLAHQINDDAIAMMKRENQELENALVRYLGYKPSLEELQQHCVRETYWFAPNTTFYSWKGETFFIVFKRPPEFDPESLTVRGWGYRFEYVGNIEEMLEQFMATLDETDPEHQAVLTEYRTYRQYKEAQ